MPLTKQDLQSINELFSTSEKHMRGAIANSEERMLGALANSENKMDSRFDKVDARFDKLEDEIKQVQVATLENFDAIEKNNKSISYLDSKVDLLNQNMTSRFEVNEEKILQVEMEVKR